MATPVPPSILRGCTLALVPVVLLWLVLVHVLPMAWASASTVTFNVNSSLDEPAANPNSTNCVSAPSSKCTLRAAVMQANQITGQDVTIILPAGIYSITIPAAGNNADDTGEFNLLSPNAGSPFITIQGAGAVTTIIDGNGLDRQFAVHGGRRAEIAGVTMRGGCCIAPGSVGGGLYILAGGTLTVTDSTITANQAESGGGIYNLGTLTLSGSTVYSNTATSNGGGLYVGQSAQATVVNSRFDENAIVDRTDSVAGGGAIYNWGVLNVLYSTLRGNRTAKVVVNGFDAYAAAGGILNFGGTATLNNVTLSDNRGGYGGGMFNYGGTAFFGGMATLNNVTFSGNIAGSGGGMYSLRSTATLNNVTFSGNSADSGGGFFSDDSTATLSHVTLSGNSAACCGGGIRQFTLTAGGPLHLRNTIVANSPSGGNCYVQSDSNTAIVSDNYNLSNNRLEPSDTSCMIFFNQPQDRNNANPNLGPLANNGGFTPTHLPLPGSAAVDAIPLNVNGCGTTYTGDQRSVSRPQGLACDIGAVEYRVGDVTPWLYLPLIRR